VSRDEVQVKRLWEAKLLAAMKHWGSSMVYFQGKAFARTFVLDMNTGAVTEQSPKWGFNSNACGWHILAGDQLVALHIDKKSILYGPAHGTPALIANVCADQRAYEDQDWMIAWGWQVGCQGGPSLTSPCGVQVLENGSLCAQANRIFRRTRSYVWNLGDAKDPFPAPKDCLAQAKVTRAP
jgi:hypothetical protein